MDGTIGLLGGIPASGDGVGGVGVPSTGPILIMSKDKAKNHNISIEDSSPYPVNGDGDDDDLELGLGLSIGGGLRTKKEASRISTCEDLMSCCLSSSSSSTSVHSASPRNATRVIGWPPIRRAHRVPILANCIKTEHEEFNCRPITNGNHLSVKVNMDGTAIGRKVNLYAHTSYETLAQTLENMFDRRRSSIEATGSSRLLDGASEFVLTYEDEDGDCMLVGDVPWQMFLRSVKRLRILRNRRM